MDHPFFWGIVFIVITSILGLGLYKARQVKTETSYLLANRKIGLFPLVATLVMTELNTSTLVAFCGLGYTFGWGAIFFPAIFLIGLLWYGLTVAEKWKAFNGLSVAHFFNQRYGKDIGMLVAVILFTAMAIFSATYVKSMTMLFLPLMSQLNLLSMSSLMVCLVLVMALRGGLISIISTDVLSFVLVCFFIPALLFFSWQLPQIDPMPAYPTLHEVMTNLPTSFIFSLIFLTMFSYILAPWYGQKIIAAKTPSIARRAVVCSAILVFCFYAVAVLATAAFKFKGLSFVNHEMALPLLIEYALPKPLQALGYAILFCIGATTLSGVWSAMTTLVIGQEQQKHSAQRSIWLTLGISLLSLFLANTLIDQILNKMILANIPIVALSFALLAGFYWPKANRIGAYASIITGIAWGSGCYFHYGEAGNYTYYWTFYGIPLIFLTGVAGSLLPLRNRELLSLKT